MKFKKTLKIKKEIGNMGRKSINFGFSFGLTSGVITTSGLIVGLYSGTHLKSIIIGGILIIAFADAFSDSLGIHISKESEKKSTKKEIWNATILSFLTKLIVTLTFLIPIIIFNLSLAILISLIWSLFLISILSYKIAKTRKQNPLKVMGEHLIIAIIVIGLSNIIGRLISTFFGTF